VKDRQTLETALQEQEQRHGRNPPRPAHWGGYRVIPGRIEFWQGRANRLHDRLLYRRQASAWTIERLAP
jgi:pyridoxamine 5'-phosphate oxidase